MSDWGPVAVTAESGALLVGSEGVHTSAVPLRLLKAFGTGSVGCEPALLLDTPPLG